MDVSQFSFAVTTVVFLAIAIGCVALICCAIEKSSDAEEASAADDVRRSDGAPESASSAASGAAASAAASSAPRSSVAKGPSEKKKPFGGVKVPKASKSSRASRSKNEQPLVTVTFLEYRCETNAWSCDWCGAESPPVLTQCTVCGHLR